VTKRDKLRRKLRNNPKGTKFSDLETLLLHFGFRLARIKGSHHFFQYSEGELHAILVVPTHGNQVKSRYVQDAIDILDELFPEMETGNEDTEDGESDGTKNP
jgi:predicted RNA binding protein YcfA (HicA-like mRNA interferase family)